MEAVKVFIFLAVYPCFLFLVGYALFCEWLDRKVYARLQNRCGPLHTGPAGLFQPLADLVKLLVKEDIVPEKADKFLFSVLPIFALAIAVTCAVLLPLWHFNLAVPSFNSFSGDLIVILYLLSLLTLILFLAGWHSTNPFSTLGGVRVMTMLFGYEVPFMLALLSPAILADSWRLAEIAAFYQARPALLAVNCLGFVVAVISLQAKLERTPFDIPHAETEIVGGTFTEYSGRKLAFFRLLADMEMVLGAGLIATLFMGGFPGGLVWGLVSFIPKTIIIVVLLALIRAMTGRIRVDQVVIFSWKYLMPLAVLQILVVLFVKGHVS